MIKNCRQALPAIRFPVFARDRDIQLVNSASAATIASGRLFLDSLAYWYLVRVSVGYQLDQVVIGVPHVQALEGSSPLLAVTRAS